MTRQAVKLVLIVDDDADSAFLLGAHLERHRLQVHASHSLADGKAQLRKLEPSVVLCDKYLGDGEGLDLFADGRPAFVRMALLLSGEETASNELARALFDGQHRKPIDARSIGDAVRAQFDWNEG